MAHDLRIGYACSEKELLTAILIEESEGKKTNVKISEPNIKKPMPLGIVESKPISNENDPGEKVWYTMLEYSRYYDNEQNHEEDL